MAQPHVADGDTLDTATGTGSSALDRLGRLADPLSWTVPERCLFAAGIYLVLMLWYAGILLLVVSRPEIAPYLKPAYGSTLLKIQCATMAAWALVAAAAWRARRRGSEPRGLASITILLAAWVITYWSYSFGFTTNLFGGLTLVAAALVGWVLFDRRVVNAAIAGTIVAIVVLAILEQAGVVPYAPIFAEAPFRAGTLERSWLITVGGVTFAMMLFLLAMLYYLIDRWHDREEKLAVTSQQLVRANEVIGRYVASQLAEQIRAGNYESLDQHERRKLTLFFSDIQNFATIADVEEPEELSAVLNEYLSEMTAIGERFGATIDKFVGDAIMIFFGAPLATSDRDHALRAVRMALAMQEHMTNLRTCWEERGIEHRFHIRIGINTGHASIGNFGSQSRMDYTAIGRQVNLAARLQAQCEPDHVLLSHSTWLLVRDKIACEPKGEITVKGFREPVRVYEVAGRTGC